MTAYRESPETDYERAERLQAALEKKSRALSFWQMAYVFGAIGTAASGFINAHFIDKAAARATLAERDAKFYEDASKVFSQKYNRCDVARDNAEQERDILATQILRRQGAPGLPASIRLLDHGVFLRDAAFEWNGIDWSRKP